MSSSESSTFPEGLSSNGLWTPIFKEQEIKVDVFYHNKKVSLFRKGLKSKWTQGVAIVLIVVLGGFGLGIGGTILVAHSGTLPHLFAKLSLLKNAGSFGMVGSFVSGNVCICIAASWILFIFFDEYRKRKIPLLVEEDVCRLANTLEKDNHFLYKSKDGVSFRAKRTADGEIAYSPLLPLVPNLFTAEQKLREAKQGAFLYQENYISWNDLDPFADDESQFETHVMHLKDIPCYSKKQVEAKIQSFAVGDSLYYQNNNSYFKVVKKEDSIEHIEIQYNEIQEGPLFLAIYDANSDQIIYHTVKTFNEEEASQEATNKELYYLRKEDGRVYQIKKNDLGIVIGQDKPFDLSTPNAIQKDIDAHSHQRLQYIRKDPARIDAIRTLNEIKTKEKLIECEKANAERLLQRIEQQQLKIEKLDEMHVIADGPAKNYYKQARASFDSAFPLEGTFDLITAQTETKALLDILQQAEHYYKSHLGPLDILARTFPGIETDEDGRISHKPAYEYCKANSLFPRYRQKFHGQTVYFSRSYYHTSMCEGERRPSVLAYVETQPGTFVPRWLYKEQGIWKVAIQFGQPDSLTTLSHDIGKYLDTIVDKTKKIEEFYNEELKDPGSVLGIAVEEGTEKIISAFSKQTRHHRFNPNKDLPDGTKIETIQIGKTSMYYIPSQSGRYRYRVTVKKFREFIKRDIITIEVEDTEGAFSSFLTPKKVFKLNEKQIDVLFPKLNKIPDLTEYRRKGDKYPILSDQQINFLKDQSWDVSDNRYLVYRNEESHQINVLFLYTKTFYSLKEVQAKELSSQLKLPTSYESLINEIKTSVEQYPVLKEKNVNELAHFLKPHECIVYQPEITDGIDTISIVYRTKKGRIEHATVPLPDLREFQDKKGIHTTKVAGDLQDRIDVITLDESLAKDILFRTPGQYFIFRNEEGNLKAMIARREIAGASHRYIESECIDIENLQADLSEIQIPQYCKVSLRESEKKHPEKYQSYQVVAVLS